jgi:putative oxidoreductase
MKLIHRIESWGDSHHPGVLDVVRVTLGVFLLLKGVAFMENIADLRYIIETQSDISVSPILLIALVYLAAFTHMAGGALIALGVLTRLAVIVQLPVVFCAAFFVNALLSPLNTELWASVVCLILLVVFMILGSGRFSLDNYLKNLNN